jgi:hypothetical protein
MRSFARSVSRRWSARWGVLLSVVFAFTAGAVYVLAVHDTGAFQLDADANTQAATPGDDWDRVCYQNAVTPVALGGLGLDPGPAATLCGTNVGTPTATAVSWAAEPNPASTIFTGGGSKDPIDINQWAWKNDANAPPDKDNLVHAYAARYSLPNSVTCPSGDPTKNCEVIFFGSDRFDNSGDSQQAFWFLQNQISTASNPIGGGSGFASSGAPEFHRLGDLLVISDFSNGGTTSTISIYKWDPGCTKDTTKQGGNCADANLRIAQNTLTGAAAKCSSANASGDAACGIVNSALITMPFAFVDKSATPNNQALTGEFYEAGLNLSKLGVGEECFATVVAETRSSTSTGAVLKDFVVGNFGRCTSGISTTPSDASGSALQNASISIGTGVASVTDSAAITVTGKSTWSGSVSFFLCGPTASGFPNCDGTTGNVGTAVGSAKTVNQTTPTALSDVVTVSSVGNYCFRGVFTSATSGVPNSSDFSQTECFTVTPVAPTLTTSASVDVVLGNPISDSATLTGTATQPGSLIINGSAGAAAGGTITFRLYGPNDNTCTTMTTGFTAIVVNVNGNGTYGPTGVSFTPTAAGTYRWVASYSGNLPNTTAPTTPQACVDASEDVVVNPAPTGITTTQTFTVKDSATITASQGGPLVGNVRFRLFNNATCNETAPNQLLFDSGNIAVSGASPQTASTSVTVNTTFTTSQPQLSWLVQYFSTNTNQQDVASACNTENAQLTIKNDP